MHKPPNMLAQLGYIALLQQLPIIPQIKLPDQAIHLGILMEMRRIAIMCARIENLYKRAVDGILQLLEDDAGVVDTGCQEILEAVLGHVVIGVLLYLG